MNCKDCFWCTLNNSYSSNKVCCNRNSKNFNKIFTSEEINNMICEDVETEQAVDYRNMTAWQFANKYYN